MRIDGATLRRGFWLCVWEATTAQGEQLPYVGRTSGTTSSGRLLFSSGQSRVEAEKWASLAAYGDAGSLRDYEYDHLVPLELGGAPNDPRNLWPEPGASPNPKDELEGPAARDCLRR